MLWMTNFRTTNSNSLLTIQCTLIRHHNLFKKPRNVTSCFLFLQVPLHAYHSRTSFSSLHFHHHPNSMASLMGLAYPLPLDPFELLACLSKRAPKFDGTHKIFRWKLLSHTLRFQEYKDYCEYVLIWQAFWFRSWRIRNPDACEFECKSMSKVFRFWWMHFL